MAGTPDDATGPRPISVFISYSRTDREYLEPILACLKPLEQDGTLRVVADHQIEAGNGWVAEMDWDPDQAGMFLLLVSPNYLASEYCYDDELTGILRRHVEGQALVVPIILMPCRWEAAPFGTFQVLPRRGKPISQFSRREEALAQIAEEVRRAAIGLRHRRASAAGPSRGLELSPQAESADVPRALELEIPRDRAMNADEIVRLGDAIRSLRQLGVEVRVVPGERP